MKGKKMKKEKKKMATLPEGPSPNETLYVT